MRILLPLAAVAVLLGIGTACGYSAHYPRHPVEEGATSSWTSEDTADWDDPELICSRPGPGAVYSLTVLNTGSQTVELATVSVDDCTEIPMFQLIAGDSWAGTSTTNLTWTVRTLPSYRLVHQFGVPDGTVSWVEEVP